MHRLFPVTGSGLEPGDRLFVTGELGGQALARARANAGAVRRITRVPEPRLAAGRLLAAMPSCTACIDLSDGLGSDLGHLLSASGVGAELFPRRVPVKRGFFATATKLGLDPWQLALAGGEDYELLFGLRSRRHTAADLADRLELPVAEIGVSRAEPGLSGLPDSWAGTPAGWRHF